MASNAIDKAADSLPTTVSGKGGGVTVAEYIEIITGAREVPEKDGSEIIAQIFGADSLEVLTKGQVEGLNSFVGKEILIHDFTINRSDDKFKDGGPVYLVLDVTDCLTGEHLKVTTGSKNVQASIGLMLKLDQWGERYRVTQDETAAGYKVTKLEWIKALESFSEANEKA